MLWARSTVVLVLLVISLLAAQRGAGADEADTLSADRVIFVERLKPPQQTNYCGMIYTTRIVVADAATGAGRRVLATNGPNCYAFGTLTLNPQRTEVAATIGGVLRLYRIADLLAGTSQPRIFTQRHYCDVPAFNADGTRIVCRSAWNTFLVVDVATLRLVGEVPLDPMGIFGQDADWLMDGTLLLSGSQVVQNCPDQSGAVQVGGVWRINPADLSAGPSPVLVPACQSARAHVGGVRAAPNGLQFAYFAYGNTAQPTLGASLRVAAVDGTDDHALAEATADVAYARFAWSPSSRYLLTEVYDRNDANPFGIDGHIDVVDVATGYRRSLVAATTSADAFSPAAAEPAGRTPPLVTGTADRPPGQQGWYRQPTTITWTAEDPDDPAGALTLPGPTVADVEGADVDYVSGPACDPAGNCATGHKTISLDRRAPTVGVRLSEAPNVEGWHREPVVATFACDDALSGMHTCPDPVLVRDDDADSVVTGTAEDTAGNTASASVAVKLDTAAPTIVATVSQASNSGRWNDGDVTIAFACTDDRSGIVSCSAPVTLTEEGADQVVTGTAVDRAGNRATASVTVSIDRTRPFIAAVRSPAGPHGWNDGPVTVSFTCSDAGSGVLDCPRPVTLAEEGAGQSVSKSVTDTAGNTATAAVTDINIDLTAPSITATVTGERNAAGWFNRPGVVHYTCRDALSGTADCSADAALAADGADLSVVGATTDRAGNSASVTTDHLNVDLTTPAVQLIGVRADASYPYEEQPAPQCVTADVTSGVRTSAGLTVSRDPTGAHIAICAGAEDVAGNRTAPITATYRVTQTTASFTALTSQYLSTSAAPEANGLMHDLSNKLRQGKICEYIAKLTTESQGPRPALTQAQAAELTYWARTLDPSCTIS